MKKYILILSVLFLALSSCGKEELALYDVSTHYLYIPNDEDKHITSMTFKHHPDLNDYDALFEVRLVGSYLEEDKAFTVEVVDDETTAHAEDFTVEKTQIFHAGVLKDNLKITLHKTPHLDEETVKVTVRLVPNETFGLADYLRTNEYTKAIMASITFDNKLSKPLWWDQNIEDNFLGEWTATKYSYFIESCDGEVLDLTDYDADEIRLLAMKFKKDIKDNDWREPNGQSITVPVY